MNGLVAIADAQEDGPPCWSEAEGKDPMPGAYIPQCTETGYYESMQCYGSIGACWCVTSTGEEILGTRMGPGEGEVDCSDDGRSNAMVTSNIEYIPPYESTMALSYQDYNTLSLVVLY